MTEEKHLFKKTYNGVIWTLLDVLFSKGFPLVIMLILARILGPSEFGLYGILIIFISIGMLLTESGLTSSLIRHQQMNKSDFSTVFYLNLMLSVAIALIICVLAPLIAQFFNQPILTDLIRFLTITYFVGALSAVHLAMLNKEMQFKKIALINAPGALIGGLAGWWFAVHHHGIWSLVYMNVISQLITSILLWISVRWIPSIDFSKSKAETHFRFGINLFLSGLLDTIFKNGYNIIIGKFYPVQSLAFFERARSLQEYPSLAITGIANKVSYPLLATLQHNEQEGNSFFKKLIKVTFFINTPLILIMAGMAKPLFLLLLGMAWLPAVPYFQILCLSSLFYPHHAYNLNVLKVKGRSDLFLKLEVVKKILMLVLMVASIPFGIIGLIWGMVLNSILALYINIYFSDYYISYSFLQQVKDLLPNLLIGILTFLLTAYLCYVMSSFPLILQTLISFILGVLCFITLSFGLNRNEFLQHLKIISGR